KKNDLIGDPQSGGCRLSDRADDAGGGQPASSPGGGGAVLRRLAGIVYGRHGADDTGVVTRRRRDVYGPRRLRCRLAEGGRELGGASGQETRGRGQARGDTHSGRP